MVKLFALHLKVALKKAIENMRLFLRYAKFRKFYLSYLCLNAFYFLKNPYQLAKRAGDLYYGETLLTTLDKISREFRVLSTDKVAELGCGSGHTVLWLATVLGCSVTGVDILDPFISKANTIKRWFRIDNAHFEKKDLTHLNFSTFTAIYLFGTSFSESLLKTLTEKLQKLPPKAKIITVSFPITDYDKTGAFELVRKIEAPFYWGKATVYLAIRKF